ERPGGAGLLGQGAPVADGHGVLPGDDNTFHIVHCGTAPFKKNPGLAACFLSQAVPLPRFDLVCTAAKRHPDASPFPASQLPYSLGPLDPDAVGEPAPDRPGPKCPKLPDPGR